MANINIFEEAFTANSKLASRPSRRKTIKESAKKAVANVKESHKSIAVNKIKFTEDVNSIEPQEDIMVVYTDEIEPDMDEEEIKEVADSLIGKDICMCGVCGANYVCEHGDEKEEILVKDEDDFVEEEEAFDESLLFKGNSLMEDVEETKEVEVSEETELECPVCGAKESQIVVGEIAPVAEAPVEEVEVKDEEEETEDGEEEKSEEEVKVEESLDSIDADADDKIERARQRFLRAKDDARADRDYKLNKARARRESLKKEGCGGKKSVKKPIPRKKAAEKNADVELDERALNRIFTKFANENYSNVASVSFRKGSLKRGQITLEGVVRTKSGKIRPIKIVSEGFNLAKRPNIIKFFEKGPFTENAQVAKNRVPFVVECTVRGNKIYPTGIKYNYVVKENKNRYAVQGRHALSETIKRK